MSLLVHGKDTSYVEVTNISTHGIWLYVRGKEYFMSFESFPWFQDQTVKTIQAVEEPRPNHFYWPSIDIDLSLEMIEYPDRFPLQSI